MSTPVTVDKILYLATDTEWSLRQTVDGVPTIPTSAKAEIRDTFGGNLWAEFTVEIDQAEGWINLTLDKDSLKLTDWQGRFEGVWDIYTVVGNESERWVMGKVTVSPNVTV